MKRIHLEFEILNQRGLKVKYDLNHSISSFIYKALDNEKLHNSKEIKNFTFSNIFFKSFKRIKSGILVKDSNAYFIVSSSEKDITENFTKFVKKSITEDKIHRISNMSFKITDYDIENNNVSPNNDMFCCETITPICLTKPGEKYEQYIHPDSEEYIHYLKKHINSRFKNSVHIDFMIDKKRAIKSKLVNIKDIKVRGFKYKFFLRCDSDIFNELYYSGIGSKCSQGLGMVKLVETQ